MPEPAKILLRLLTGSPVRLTALCAAITPGAHLLVSALVEKRAVTWANDYPAVLIGDPLLAITAGVAASAARPNVLADSALTTIPVVTATLAGGALFGGWQLNRELREGRYTPSQAFSPSKLWHQFIVYPVLPNLVLPPVIAVTKGALAAESTKLQRRAALFAWTGVAIWAALTAEAIAHPRQGHGAYDWAKMESVSLGQQA